MSWNHTQEYETAGYQDYASRLGGGQYEKVWDLGEPLFNPLDTQNSHDVGLPDYWASSRSSQPGARPPTNAVPWCLLQSYMLQGEEHFQADHITEATASEARLTWIPCAGADHKFLCDHVVDGRILMPATSYVVTAWEALCHMKSRKMEETPVVFEDVQIRQAVTAEEGQKIALAVLIAPDNRFCVSTLATRCSPERLL